MNRLRAACSLLLSAVTFNACLGPSEGWPIELRVLTYNIKHGAGNDRKVDLSRAADLIRRVRPDLVVLQEIDHRARRSLEMDQMAYLADFTRMHARFGAFMPFDGGQYGMGLLSRFPILEAHNYELPRGPEPRTALAARIQLPNGGELLLCNVHFYATEEERLAQARTVVELFEKTKLPMILAGDFNSTPDSPVMALIESQWTNVEKGADRFTFSSTNPNEEIDYVLVRPKKRFEVVSIDVLDEPVISDHRPVLAVLRLSE